MSCSLSYVFLLSICFADVVKLTDANFDEIVKRGEENRWFIKFYAPWCGHCNKLAPVWIELAESLKDKVMVGEVDATEERGLSSRFGIEGYPTLLMLYDGMYVEYNGKRVLEEMESFALEKYQEETPRIIGRMPSSIMTQMDKLGTQVGELLYEYPLVTCAFFVVVGIFFGMSCTYLYFEIRSLDEYEEDDKPSNEEKEGEDVKEKED